VLVFESGLVGKRSRFLGLYRCNTTIISSSITRTSPVQVLRTVHTSTSSLEKWEFVVFVYSSS